MIEDNSATFQPLLICLSRLSSTTKVLSQADTNFTGQTLKCLQQEIKTGDEPFFSVTSKFSPEVGAPQVIFVSKILVQLSECLAVSAFYSISISACSFLTQKYR
jgi:hypothetical protein